jgi:hypothetical protein
MQAYDTLSAAINGLREQGYTLDFNLAFDQLRCAQNGLCLNPTQFEITGHHRFEGYSNPDDASILYMIVSKDGTMKGLLVNAYGVYSDPVSDDMLRKLTIAPY